MLDENIFSKDKNFHGAKGIIFIDDKMLVYRRDTKTESFPLCIDLPGGGKESGESPFETFQREVMEEFNVRIEKEDIVYSRKYVSPMDPTKESYFLVTKSLDSKSHPITFEDEGLEFFLYSVDDYLNAIDVIERQRVRVKDYLNSIL